jgi:hypothetical protein
MIREYAPKSSSHLRQRVSILENFMSFWQVLPLDCRKLPAKANWRIPRETQLRLIRRISLRGLTEWSPLPPINSIVLDGNRAI